jgi:hypothetical protein
VACPPPNGEGEGAEAGAPKGEGDGAGAPPKGDGPVAFEVEPNAGAEDAVEAVGGMVPACMSAGNGLGTLSEENL